MLLGALLPRREGRRGGMRQGVGWGGVGWGGASRVALRRAAGSAGEPGACACRSTGEALLALTSAASLATSISSRPALRLEASSSSRRQPTASACCSSLLWLICSRAPLTAAEAVEAVSGARPPVGPGGRPPPPPPPRTPKPTVRGDCLGSHLLSSRRAFVRYGSRCALALAVVRWRALRSGPTPDFSFLDFRLATQRVTRGFSGAESPSFRYFIRRNPPMPLRVAYRRVLGLIA
jgi:hypothetical protein